MAQDNYGANKAARRAAERRARQKENIPPPLDPDFPFTAIAFDPEYFGAKEEHDPPAEEAV